MLLIFDNYDSFTFNLCDYFKQLGQQLLVIRNDEMSLEDIEKLGFSAIVLSPGPGTPETSGLLMPLIHRWVGRVPILGICLGHQALGMHFGARLIRIPYPMHGKISKLRLINHSMWEGLPRDPEVCRYHSLALEAPLPEELVLTSTSDDDGMILSFAHRDLPVWGIQFHPEAILTRGGIDILNNWLNEFTLHTLK